MLLRATPRAFLVFISTLITNCSCSKFVEQMLHFWPLVLQPVSRLSSSSTLYEPRLIRDFITATSLSDMYFAFCEKIIYVNREYIWFTAVLAINFLTLRLRCLSVTSLSLSPSRSLVFFIFPFLGRNQWFWFLLPSLMGSFACCLSSHQHGSGTPACIPRQQQKWKRKIPSDTNRLPWRNWHVEGRRLQTPTETQWSVWLSCQPPFGCSCPRKY